MNARIVKRAMDHLLLEFHYPTAFDAKVTILAENAEEASRPVGVNAFLNWHIKANVKSGKTEQIKIAIR